MRKVSITFILLALFILPLLAEKVEHEGLTWYTTIEEGQAQMTEGKTLFLLFTGTDWCPWCVKLQDEILYQEEFKAYAAENLVFVKLNFLRKTQLPKAVVDYNMKQLNAYHVRGFPTVLLYNADGEKVGTTGYIQGGPQKFLRQLNEQLQDYEQTHPKK
ncbi:MAG: thioredoxin family protein [Candidatus Cloacimonetes bacterium]|nr:thioredoxin family protein [Candidatus Cloacimonadota bacterium]